MADRAQGKSGIKVFLLDDHEIVRRGVKDMLEAEPDITVIGEAGTAEAPLARNPPPPPHVAVLDRPLPRGDRGSGGPDNRSRLPEGASPSPTSFAAHAA